ncbi:hypothetical protein [Modestobacter sp. SYSU DS0290]
MSSPSVPRDAPAVDRDEAEVRRFARRRLATEDAGALAFGVVYAAVLLTMEVDPALACAVVGLGVLIRLGSRRWGNGSARHARARADLSLRRGRPLGWARAGEVTRRARERQERIGWRRFGAAAGLLTMGAVVVVSASSDRLPDTLSVLACLVAVQLTGDLVRQEREVREARRWLAGPPD